MKTEMEKDLELAKSLLAEKNCTCVFARNGKTAVHTESGVKPLMTRINFHEGAMEGISVADKIVGTAAAMLLIFGKAAAVYSPVMSEHAAELLRSYGIHAEYGKLVKEIRNRTNSGPCPMELAVRNIDDPAKAPDALKAAIENMKR
jgi:hypothetical protein